ncbi:MAG TPA: insulinase family protein, partial [Pyrinomonadaceae bacterium]
MKRNLSILFILWALCVSMLAPPARAQSPATTTPGRAAAATTATATAPARALQQAQLVNRVLANGLEVIVLEDHSVPLVTIELAVKNGSYTEPPELNGLSHLYEHMFFKVNPLRARQADYLRTIDQLGI